MKHYLSFAMLLITLVILLLSGCTTNKSQAMEGVMQIYRPDWWGFQTSDVNIYSFGQAEKLNEAASMDAARANALLEAAKYVEAYANDKLQAFENEAGVKDPQVHALSQKVAKTISTARFANLSTGITETIQVQTKDGIRYKTFIQLVIPHREIDKYLINQVRSEEILYMQLRGSKAFKQMDDSLK
jgi:hypothetical protein